MASKQWYCVSTRTGKELLAKSRLNSRLIDTLLPMVKAKRHNGFGGYFTVDRPLFPGYLFAFTTLNDYQNAAFGVGKEILRLVGFAGLPERIDADVIEEIRARTEHGYVKLAEAQMPAQGFTPDQSVIVADPAWGRYDWLFVRDESRRIVVLRRLIDEGGSVREFKFDRSIVQPSITVVV